MRNSRSKLSITAWHDFGRLGRTQCAAASRGWRMGSGLYLGAACGARAVRRSTWSSWSRSAATSSVLRLSTSCPSAWAARGHVSYAVAPNGTQQHIVEQSCGHGGSLAPRDAPSPGRGHAPPCSRVRLRAKDRPVWRRESAGGRVAETAGRPAVAGGPEISLA